MNWDASITHRGTGSNIPGTTSKNMPKFLRNHYFNFNCRHGSTKSILSLSFRYWSFEAWDNMAGPYLYGHLYVFQYSWFENNTIWIIVQQAVVQAIDEKIVEFWNNDIGSLCFTKNQMVAQYYNAVRITFCISFSDLTPKSHGTCHF